MDPETKRLLEENLALSRETNELLKKVVSAQRWARVFRVFYWLVIIGISIGAFYYIQPYLNQILGSYQSVLSSINKIQKTTQSLPDTSGLDINSILNTLQKGR